MRWRGRGAAAVAAAAVVLVVSLATCGGGHERAGVVVGATTSTQATALPQATVVTPPPPPAAAPGPPGPPAPGPVRGGLKPADWRPYPPAIAFRSSVPVPSELAFVLVVGSDARPGQDIRRTNADSVHLLAVNPRTGEGTVVGIPRDAWVEIPGRGRGRINSALPAGGPGLLVDTVRRLTGLPVHYYVLTGFAGMASMVDALAGVGVHLDRRMDDAASGARFEAGWHHFNGAQALAFTRNRKDAPGGDFGRSANQGTLILAALSKMRAEVGDDAGLRRWVEVLGAHVALDVPPAGLLGLAALGRTLDPARLRNVVAPGRIGYAGSQSVVYLTEEAGRLFLDLRDDATVGGATAPPPPPPSTAAPTTTTTGPAPPTTAPPTTAPPTDPPITLLP